MEKAPQTKMKPPVLIALLVGGVLLFGALGWFVLVRPQGAKVKSLQKQQEEIQQKIDDQREQAAAARGVPKIRVADVYRLAKAMPDGTDMPDLLLELSQLARSTGIDFDSISPQPTVTLTGYQALPVKVTFNGNFFNLADFLYRLRTLVDVHNSRLDATGRLFTVDSISFTEGSDHFPTIQASLVVNAYVFGNTAPSAAGTSTSTDTTASTTTSTTTTSTDTTSTTTTTTPTEASPTASASAAGAP